MQGFGFGKYYPWDFDPAKEGSVNKLNGKHALGDRAKKISEGILIVRFELPFNIWCDGCDKHLGMGVRYNAEKKKIGNYFSTPIFSFRCKCHLCSNWFTVETDPKNTRYVVTQGARQKNEEWDPGENGGIPIIEEKSLIEPDAFASLEKDKTQKVKALSTATALSSLQDLSHARSFDPYTLNKKLRASFRTEKAIRVISEKKSLSVVEKYGLERVTVQDLMTPRDVGVKEEEDAEWEAARMEKRRREGILNGKRRREEEVIPSSSSTSASRSTARSLPSGLSKAKVESKSKVDASNRLKSLANKLFAGAKKQETVFGGSSTRTNLELKGVKKRKLN